MMPDSQIGELLGWCACCRTNQIATSPEELVIAMLCLHARFMPLSVRTVIDFFATRFGAPPYWKDE